jgi:hypothetical protein
MQLVVVYVRVAHPDRTPASCEKSFFTVVRLLMYA